MAITSIKTGSSFTNLVKYNDFLGPNSAYIPSSYESIASATGTGSTVITFSSIPSTYSHLQLRCIYKTTGTTANWVYANITLNNDATNNYTEHVLSGDGTSATATNTASSGGARPQVYGYTSAAAFGSNAGVAIVDIHDYASSTKNKTIRTINGLDYNTSGYAAISLRSSVWLSTSAVNRIDITVQGGNGNFATGTTFALYGIKG